MDIFQILYFLETVVFVIISVKICRGLSCCYSVLFKQNSELKRIFVYSTDLKKELKNTINIMCPFFIFWAIIFNFEYFLIAFFIVAVHYFSTYPEKNHVLEMYNLHPGHGAALAYYKNYLEMTLTERFSERVDRFNSENMITMQKKLYILVPQTCRVHRYLDSIENENIERCRELPDEQISHAGIKNRTYNITIYNINGLRMAVEFAQPLKALYLFKEKGLFTDEEMFNERRVFVNTLKEFLMKDQFKYFEIVEYDDSVLKIEKALLKSYYDSSENFYDLETV